MDGMKRVAVVTCLLAGVLAASGCRVARCGDRHFGKRSRPVCDAGGPPQGNAPKSARNTAATAPAPPPAEALAERPKFDSDEWEERMIRALHPSYNGVSSWACWGMPGPPSVWSVLAADADANVYVISCGVEDGVKVGSLFRVSRGGECIATIQIDDVEAKISAGSVTKDIAPADIRRGDQVKSAE